MDEPRMICPKCKTPIAARVSKCPKCGAAAGPIRPSARATESARPARPTPPPGLSARKKSILYAAIAGSVVLALAVAAGVMLSTTKRESGRLSRKADEMARTVEELRGSAATKDAAPRVYKDEARGFEIPIPDGWKAARGSGSAVLEMSRDDAVGSSFALVLQPIPAGAAAGGFSWEARLEDLVRDLRASLKDLRVTRKEEGTCCGHPAFLVAYSYRLEGTSLVMLQYMVASPERLHVLTWSTSDALYRTLGPALEKASKAYSIPHARTAPRKEAARQPPSSFSPEELALPTRVFTHPSEGFSLPIPEGWKTEGFPRVTVSGSTLLATSLFSKGCSGEVRIRPTPRELAGSDPDWQASTEIPKTAGPREKGTCGGHPALLVVTPSSPTSSMGGLTYYVVTPERLWTISWRCRSQDFDLLRPVLERCSKGFALQAQGVKTPVPARNPRLDPTWFPSVHTDADLGFSIPVPKGWKATGKPRGEGSPDVLTLTDLESRSGSLRIRAEKTPKDLALGGKAWPAFLESVRKEGEASGWLETKMEEQREGACRGHPAFQVRWFHRSADGLAWNTVAYYVATPETLFRIEGDFSPPFLRQVMALIQVCLDHFTVPDKK